MKRRGGSTDWDTDAWYTSFLKRHKERLRPGAVKGLKSTRVRTTVHDQIEEWAEFYPEYITEHKISAKSIINPDETRVTIQGELAQDGVESTGKRKRAVLEMTRGLGATYIPFQTHWGK